MLTTSESETKSAFDQNFTYLGLILFGILYPIWGTIHKWFNETADDGFLMRSPFLVACIAILTISRRNQWHNKKTRLYLVAILWLATAHFYFIILTNTSSSITTVGTLVQMIGICFCLATWRELICYSTVNLAALFFVYRSIQGVDWLAMWFSAISINTYLFVGVQLKSMLESQLIHANAKNLAMLKLAAQAAHDIRSPISALNLVLEAKSAQTLPVTEKEIIRTALYRIKKTSEDLLDNNRTLFRTNSEKSYFDIVKAIHEIINEKHLVFENAQIDFQYKTDSLIVSGEKADFQRAISNLLNNSYESRSNNCHICVQLDKNDAITIRISDNGPGINPKILPELFIKKSDGNIVSGYGLGLVGTQNLLNSMNFNISLEKSDQNGTSFIIKKEKAAFQH